MNDCQGWALQKLIYLPDLKAVLPINLSFTGKPMHLQYCYVLRTSSPEISHISNWMTLFDFCGDRLGFMLLFERHFSLGENFLLFPFWTEKRANKGTIIIIKYCCLFKNFKILYDQNGSSASHQINLEWNLTTHWDLSLLPECPPKIGLFHSKMSRTFSVLTLCFVWTCNDLPRWERQKKTFPLFPSIQISAILKASFTRLPLARADFLLLTNLFTSQISLCYA